MNAATSVYALHEIMRALPDVDVVAEVAKGFEAFSRGEVDVPPVGELLFPDERGEMHIKYGAVRGDDVFVVKIATGFFGNARLGLPPFGGCMLVLSQKTGMVLSVLLEEGELTNHRTAAAGAVAARALAPEVTAIGILGAGVQARLQADYLRRVTPCRRLILWARAAEKADAALADIAALGFTVQRAGSVAEVGANANLIVTTTAAHEPILLAEDVRPGTHITAMGSDTPEKNELAPALLARADRVVADSKAQCLERGEIFKAVAAGAIAPERVVELGAVLSSAAPGRTRADEITVADLTGVAVQDIAIAKAVVARMKAR